MSDDTTADDRRPDEDTLTEGETTEDTFPRKVVEDLRRESAGYRDRAKTAETRAEQLARALHHAKVAATGKLADPTDLPFQPEHLEDDGTLTAAIDALLEDKPHLRARRTTGNIGQGQHGKESAPQDFSQLFQ